MLNNQSGAIAIITAILLTAFLGFVALSVDTGHLVVTKNELQNAADAGALAGARDLYNSNGSAVNTNCNQTAKTTAISNLSEKSPVEVIWTSGNTGDVERGHWSFGRGVEDRGFTANDSIARPTIIGVSDKDLDDDEDFINAVRVTARREATPIVSFFARIFGINDSKQTATAIGYIGFAGSFAKYELDQPIAICLESVTTTNADGEVVFNCNIGRMISDEGDKNTAGWTDFEQSEDCNGVNSNYLTNNVITCDEFSGNQTIVEKGLIETGGGAIASVYTDLKTCWESKTNKKVSWDMKLPVIDCSKNNVETCSEIVAGVQVQVVWMTGLGTPKDEDAPTEMDDWSSNDADGAIRWASFVNHFGLKKADGSDAPHSKKSIYFKPSCVAAEPSGGTGGENLGVLARIPVLVE
jgi:Flp pilus assembly protein TadG